MGILILIIEYGKFIKLHLRVNHDWWSNDKFNLEALVSSYVGASVCFVSWFLGIFLAGVWVDFKYDLNWSGLVYTTHNQRV